MLKGMGISQGYASAKAFVYKKRSLEFKEGQAEDVQSEILRLDESFDKSKNQIENLIITACIDDAEKKEILSVQIEILEDEAFIEMAKSIISEQKHNAETALSKTGEHFINLFESMDDEYFSARAIDLKDVADRVLENLIYGDYTSNLILKEKSIVAAYELTPSETVQLNKDTAAGIITQLGTKTSHVAIVARSMDIPLVTGIVNIYEHIKTDDMIAIDGVAGCVYVNPDSDTMIKFAKEEKHYAEYKLLLQKYKGKRTQTKSGKIIELCSNIGNFNDAEAAKENDAEGSGLFRTEFLYMNRDTLPSEDEQFEQYKSVLELMGEKYVIVRTLDIGGDKNTECIDIEAEENPFLGHRAIRLCLDRKEIFSTQLRAMLRASAYGKMRIMFPMISSFEELFEAKGILKDVMKELDKQSIQYDKNIEVGMMIETPSSVFMADDFAELVDFFSIGTNDLTQYVMAADRNNPKVMHLNSDKNPVIWRMIKKVIDAAHEKDIWVGVCGEIANNHIHACMLTAMGIDELSVSANNILQIRKSIIEMDEDEYKKKLEKIMEAKTACQVESIMQ